MPGKIKKLSENVINRIAAGEIIADPAAIVKELMENSIDAKSTAVSVNISEGGFSLIEITDNGSGIDYEDFELLCERYATSKISNSDDLKSISSFGFRGEALASVSFVSNLTVISKTPSSDVAYQASFSDGKILPNTDNECRPECTDGENGTKMIVQDLFKNMKVRKAGLSPTEEYQKIMKLIMKFAIHHYLVAFTLKKNGTSEISSMNLARNKRTPFEIRKDLIQKLYGKNISENLLEHMFEMEACQVKIELFFTKPDRKIKGKNLILFINERLVESDSIKQAIQTAYQNCSLGLYETNSDFFCYLNLQIKKDYIDVNVNPTKKTVHFLNEKIISERIQCELEDIIKESMNVKSYKAPVLRQITFESDKLPLNHDIEKVQANNKPKVIYDRNLVRTDSRAQSLDKFLVKSTKEEFKIIKDAKSEQLEKSDSNSNISSKPRVSTSKSLVEEVKKFDDEKSLEEEIPEKKPSFTIRELKSLGSQDDVFLSEYKIIGKNLLADFHKSSDSESTKFLQELVFVGCMNSNYISCQHEQKLYLGNFIPIFIDGFYQIILKNIEKLDKSPLARPINIREKLYNAILSCQPEGFEDDDFEKIHERSIRLIQENSIILKEAFGILIIEEEIIELPKIFGFEIKEEDVGTFLLRIVTEADFSSTKSSIQTISLELATYLALSAESHDEYVANTKEKLLYDDMIGVHFFSLMKSSLKFSAKMKEKYFVELLQLSDIYRIFERC